MRQPDLFAEAVYPHAPGHRGTDTSIKAAIEIAPLVGNLQSKVLATLSAGARMTADEIASAMNRSLLSVRPRVTELYRLGRVRDTGQRRKNDVSGKDAIVWERVDTAIDSERDIRGRLAGVEVDVCAGRVPA